MKTASTTLRRATVLAAAACVLVGSASAAYADDEPWRIGLTAYGWATNVSGNATARGQTVDINASFIDVIQKSNSLGAFMAYLEADKGRAGLYADFAWMQLGFSRSLVSYRNPLPGLTVTANGNEGLRTDLTMLEVGGLYELAHWQGGEASSTALDAVLGFRYWNNTTTASLDALGTASYAPLGIGASRSIGISVGSTMQWVDPVVGLRVRHEFTPEQSILVRGDVGGFGLGSQFTWQALGVYNYRWKRNGYDLSAIIGYRAIGFRYVGTGSGFDASGLDLVLHGPVIGFGVTF